MEISRRTLLAILTATGAASAVPSWARVPSFSVTAPGEFEPQDFIWLSWKEDGFLGSAPFSSVTTEVMRLITPHVMVRLLYTDEQPPYSFGDYRATRLPRDQAEAQILDKLRAAGIGTDRVRPFYYPTRAFGAIQDPGPFFLRTSNGGLAIADYRFDHPDTRMEAMDREIAAELGLPTVHSSLFSEGGGRQSNGRGTLLLVKKVEQARNPSLSLPDIEREHLRVHGARKVIWLEEGPADEEWGLLDDGRYGIGTGGHVDVFARFADPSTVLLAEVSQAQRDAYPMAARTYARMERNFEILQRSTDQDGQPWRIIRVPVPDPLTATYEVDSMTKGERSWFEGAKPGTRIEFYLPAGYLNFIIANGVVVTAKLHEPGRADSFAQSDEAARIALQAAFPSREIAQVGVTPLLHDGGGLHCYSRNQPSPS